MASLADIVIDCHHPASLARFWACALDGYEIAPYDDPEIDRLASQGIDDVNADPTALVQAESGPRLWSQRVDELEDGENRVRLDVRGDDPACETDHLVRPGACVLSDCAGHDRIVMVDPEGNEYA